MRRPKIEFLPAFFTVLAIVFAIALWVRIRSYSTMPEPTAQPQQQNQQPADRPPVFARTANATASPTVETPQSRAANAAATSARETRRWATKKIDYTQLPPLPATATI